MSIEAINVTKLYGEQKALNDVSFKIETGKITAFLGPNGAGKSTMMKILTGFIPPTSGIAMVNDFDVMKNSIEVRKNIGYLPEHNPLYTDMYIKEYLDFTASVYKIKHQRKRKIQDIINRTGLDKEQNKKIGTLSKGYRQRVGLAQALIHEPSVLILDEPTTGLDPNQIIEIRNLISEVGKEKTVMLSTHIMQEVEAICDKVIIVNQGKIVADEDTAKIQNTTTNQQQTVLVEFNTKQNQSELTEIEGVTSVAKITDNKWLVQSNDTIDVREKIFEFAVQKKVAILSLQKQERSMEDIFREFTKK